MAPNVQEYPLQAHLPVTQVVMDTASIQPDVQPFTTIQPLGRAPVAPQANATSQGIGVVNGVIVTPNDQPFSDSPSSVRDDFTNWLFDNSQGLWNGLGATGAQPLTGTTDFSDPLGLALGSNYFANPFGSSQYPSMLPGQSPLDVFANTQDPVLDTTLSPERRTYLIELMHTRFNGGNEPNGQFQREQILNGNMDSEEHVLSLRLMRSYLGSYWQNFHDQFPILHRPTFSADQAPDLLVLAVMTIGASLLGSEYGTAKTAAAQNFANFVVWHLRWQVYMDSNFQPPARLWVFQTLLLLEVYEKMNATRALHERANIHYATTINLMRRSTALNEDLNLTQRPPASPQEWWERWINSEATRRVAYAAFLLDATHATMFGHSAVMVVQEIRLPLPCDESLWSAASAAAVGLVESSLHANAIKPTTFLQGLKRVLTGRRVRTNSFGRLVLMAGLLSISWHMRQRELQMSTLGVPQAMAVPETWRSTLTGAFDFWKRDFDEDIAHMRMAPNGWHFSGVRSDNAASSDHAAVLHHLSHLAMQVDVTDCQIAAGAEKLLGRAVTTSERDRVYRKMSKWCRSEGANQALSHAVRLLDRFLFKSSGTGNAGVQVYKAREDCLLSRPWVLYFAGLVVWCYDFFSKRNLDLSYSAESGSPAASDSASPRPAASFQPITKQLVLDYPVNYEEIRAFLSSAASKSPAELASNDMGEQAVNGLLQLIAASFSNSRWELLHEAATRLSEAIAIARKGD